MFLKIILVYHWNTGLFGNEIMVRNNCEWLSCSNLGIFGHYFSARNYDGNVLAVERMKKKIKMSAARTVPSVSNYAHTTDL